MDGAERNALGRTDAAPFAAGFLRTAGQLLGVGEQDIVPDENRRKNTLIFTTIGTLALLGFGLVNVGYSEPARLHLMGLVQILEVCFLLAPAVWLTNRGTRPVWAENMLVFAGFVIFASNVVFGGQSGDSPYWTFVYPYLVFFLRGQKVGWAVGLLFSISVPVLMYYSSSHWHFWTYDPLHCVYYGVSYFFNVLTAAYFNLLRSMFQKQLWSQVEFNTGEVRRHLATLQFNSTHDLPTRLPNRQGFIDALATALTAHHKEGGYLLVVCIRFFRVSELASMVGLDTVDASMALLAGRLRQQLPGVRVLGRPSHDKLALVLWCERADEAALAPVREIRHMRHALDPGEFSIHVEYTFGVAVQACGEAAWAGELVRKAEQALLFADDNDLASQLYDSALSAHFVARNHRYEKLREALFSEQLTLHYQPQLDLRSGRVVGAEALARWFDPEEGPIAPDRFIPIIESTGLLHRFSVWTIALAVRDCAAWQAQLPGATVSINLSAESLHDAEVLHSLEQALARWQLDPALVVIELTESVLLKTPADALAHMERLVELGARLSIDDYGAGFSSLTYLKQLPAHEMKIDMSFVRNLRSSPQDQAIVKSSIELGHDLHFKVLAEGIEDAAALQLLTDAGCDLGQGWYFSKALPVADFVAWALNRQANAPTVKESL